MDVESDNMKIADLVSPKQHEERIKVGKKKGISTAWKSSEFVKSVAIHAFIPLYGLAILLLQFI
jgi:hypothetical protein